MSPIRRIDKRNKGNQCIEYRRLDIRVTNANTGQPDGAGVDVSKLVNLMLVSMNSTPSPRSVLFRIPSYFPEELPFLVS